MSNNPYSVDNLAQRYPLLSDVEIRAILRGYNGQHSCPAPELFNILGWAQTIKAQRTILRHITHTKRLIGDESPRPTDHKIGVWLSKQNVGKGLPTAAGWYTMAEMEEALIRIASQARVRRANRQERRAQ